MVLERLLLFLLLGFFPITSRCCHLLLCGVVLFAVFFCYCEFSSVILMCVSLNKFTVTTTLPICLHVGFMIIMHPSVMFAASCYAKRLKYVVGGGKSNADK